jgi:hypothetical protein
MKIFLHNGAYAGDCNFYCLFRYIFDCENMNVKMQSEQKTVSLSRDLNTGPADYKSAALPTKPLRRHSILTLDSKKDGAARQQSFHRHS